MFSLTLCTSLGLLVHFGASNVFGVEGDQSLELVASESAGAQELHQLEISFVVDGSGRLEFSSYDIVYEHGRGDRPTNAKFGPQDWPNIAETPERWATRLGRRVDLSQVRIVSRTSRDIIGLERTDDGFALFFSDTPPGSATYKVILELPLVR